MTVFLLAPLMDEQYLVCHDCSATYQILACVSVCVSVCVCVCVYVCV